MAEITAQAVNEFRKKTGSGTDGVQGTLEGSRRRPEKGGNAGQGTRPEASRAARRPRRQGRPGRSSTSTTTPSPARWSSSIARPTSSPATTSSSSWPRTWRSTSWRPTRCSSAARTFRRDVIAEQKRIFMSQVGDKPVNIQEKIAEGKLNAWFGESVLLDQKFVKDETKTVREVILAVNCPHRRKYLGRPVRPVQGRRSGDQRGRSKRAHLDHPGRDSGSATRESPEDSASWTLA